MSKLSKRAISILIVSMFMLSIIPMAYASIELNELYPVPGDRNQVGDTIIVKGTGVTAGATVNLYWDYVTTAGLVNNTVAEPSGAFEVWVDVPDTPAGDHYIWVKDMETTLSDSVRVVVLPEISLSGSSGLAGEDLEVDGTGFGADDDMTLYFGPIYLPAFQLIELYGDSTADWATDPQTTPDGYGDVVKFLGVAASESKVAVYIADGPTFSSFNPNTLAFWYYGAIGVDIPEFELRFEAPDCVDPDDGTSENRAHIDITFASQDTVGATGWTETGAYADSETVIAFGNFPDGGETFGPGWVSPDHTLNPMIYSGIRAAILALPHTVDINDWVLTRIAPQMGWDALGTIYVDLVECDGYEYNLTSPIKTLTSGDDGSFSTTFRIPDMGEGPFNVSAVGTSDFWDWAEFTIGACITLDDKEGPSGTIVTINGRGFTDNEYLDTILLGGTPVETVDGTVAAVQVSGTGKFEVEVVIPNKAEGKYDLIVVEVGAVKSASAKFKVDGETVIKVSPTYGTPGATITVKGYNFTQIADTVVTVVLGVDTLVTAETEADGTFEDTFISPAIDFKTYTITATDEYSLIATDEFKVGLIAMIINPRYGGAGSAVSLTGIGFADGDFNLTFGDILTEYPAGVDEEAISIIFYVPNVPVGTYDVTVIDEDENEMMEQFMVTAVTAVTLDPVVAPNLYNVSIEGINFADVVGTVDFVIYNSTEDWDMDVDTKFATVTLATKTTLDGNFSGHWYVLDDDELSIGDYTINITDSQDMLVQVPFSVVAARVSVMPRKAEFDRGDMIQFDIKNDFKLPYSFIEIYNPSNILYWSTEVFQATWWLQVEGLYTVPYYRQTAAENPMELQSDAPMGTWLYRFYEDADTELMNGTFTVGPSTAAQVEEMLTEVWGSIDDLTENIDGITDEIADDIDALSGEMDDKFKDVEDKIGDITADIADDLAQVAKDTEAAVSDLEGAIGDIAGAQNELASELDAIGQDTSAAKEAAEDAQTAATGLTSLVYGAIGASLIAALAAIVSLMQISKKIA